MPALRITCLLGVAALAAVAATAGPAAAAPSGDSTISHATLEWGINQVWNGAAANGACSQFIAGVSDGTEATYRTVDGGLHLIKRAPNGDAVETTRDNRCTELAAGDSGQRALWIDGAGTVDQVSHTATIHWTGALTVNSYGGLVPWYIKDPTLTVAADGTASITAEVGGFASSISDPNDKTPLTPEPNVDVLDLKNVSITGDSITSSPVYQGVDYFPLNNPNDPTSGRRATSAIPASVKQSNPNWGSWPTPFVDFQFRTGLSTYWLSSGGSADPNKAPLPVTVGLDGGLPAFVSLTSQPSITTQPQSAQQLPGETAHFSVAGTGDGPLQYQWQRTSPSNNDWQNIPSATGTSLDVPAVSVADNGRSYRAVVSNGQRSVVSDGAGLTVADQAPVTEEYPQADFTTFAGNTPSISVYFSGFPKPRYKPQLSRDHGQTWTDLADWGVEGFYTLPAVGVDLNGAQVRFLADNGRQPVVEGVPATMTVLPQPVKPTLIFNPDYYHTTGPIIDPSVDSYLLLKGGGFPVPTPDAVYAVLPAQEWAARGAHFAPTDAIGRFDVESDINFFNGYAEVGISLSAGDLDPTKQYVAVVFAQNPDDRSMDAAAPITLTGQVGGSDSQTVTATVPQSAGEFSWSIDGTSRAVTMSAVTDHGSYLQATGDLVPVSVTDTRAGGPTWSIAGQLGDFSGGLSGKYLGWTPSVQTAGAGAAAGAAVAPGLATGNGLTDPSTLATAAAGHAIGTARVGAALDLQVPAATPAGTYTATLTLTALS